MRTPTGGSGFSRDRSRCTWAAEAFGGSAVGLKPPTTEGKPPWDNDAAAANHRRVAGIRLRDAMPSRVDRTFRLHALPSAARAGSDQSTGASPRCSR